MTGDLFRDVLQIGAACTLCYVLLMIGRALAARISGPDNAEIVLGMSLVSISFAAPLPRRIGDSDNSAETNTDNTTTPDNTGQQPAPQVVVLNSNGDVSHFQAMPQAELDELRAVRHEAIGLLNRCVGYCQKESVPDDGTIPRFDKLKMNSKDRGVIVDNLWYSMFVIKTQNRTYTDPQYYQTCAALMKAIIDGKAKVYPIGYSERRQALTDSAVMSLPEVQK